MFLSVLVLAGCATKQDVAMRASAMAVSNFLAVMQAEPNPGFVFSKAQLDASATAVVLTAPGFIITVGNSTPSTNALLSQTWHSEQPEIRLVVQHLAHAYMEGIRAPHHPVFSPSPAQFDTVPIKKAPIIYRRPAKSDIQVLLNCFADKGIVLKTKEQESPKKVLDAYFPKAADGHRKDG